MATLPIPNPNVTSPPVLNIPSYGLNFDELEKCINISNKPPPDDGHVYCPATFDHWLCWDYARAGTTSRLPCPYEFNPELRSDGYATKICTEDGTWFRHPVSNKTWSDYYYCANENQAHIIIYVSISGYTISCVLLLLSIAIFNIFRQLRCTRVILHQHLFVSFILSGIMWIMYSVTFMTNPDLKEDNPAWCKVIHVITQYVTVSNYFWMFCEGFFLHTIVVQAFSKQKKLLIACIVIGWGGPILPIIAYVLARALDTENDVLCWYDVTWAIWILSVPILMSLVVSFILLLNVLRILLSKIRAFNAEHNQNRRAVKATLILVPLLGLQNLLIIYKPSLDKKGMFIWDLAAIILISYQGAVVALVFCFFNGEVLAVLKRRWTQWRHSYDASFLGRPSNNSTTMAMTLDDTSTTGAVFKNGSSRLAKTSSRNAKEITELQPMVPGGKGEKEVSFKS